MESEVEKGGTSTSLCDLPIEDDIFVDQRVCIHLDDDFVSLGRNCTTSDSGDEDDDNGGCKVSDEDENGDSLVYGLQVGANRQYGSWVLGFEWDWTWVDDSHAAKKASFEYFHSEDEVNLDLFNKAGTGHVEIEGELDWLTTFRLRAGWAIGDEGRFLGYLTGGVAAARMDLDGHASFSEDGDAPRFGAKMAASSATAKAMVTSLSLAGSPVSVASGPSGIMCRSGLNGCTSNSTDEEEFSTTFYADDGRSFDIRGEAGLDSIDIVRGKVNFLLNW